MEILDIYDSNGNPTGRTHQRYTPLGPGEFCLAAAVIIYNSAGEILCTLRSPDKKLAPNQWESPGGSVLAGETSREGAVRELWEETGIPASADELRLLGRSKLRDVFLDVYALHKDSLSILLILPKASLLPLQAYPAASYPLDCYSL